VKIILTLLVMILGAQSAFATNWLSGGGVYKGRHGNFCDMRLSGVTTDGYISFKGVSPASGRCIQPRFYFKASLTKADVYLAVGTEPSGTPDPDNLLIVNDDQSITLRYRGSEYRYVFTKD